MVPLKIVLFYGSTRAGRLVERVGSYVKGVVEAKGMEAIVLDPNELPVEMLKMPLHFHPNPSEAPHWMQETNENLQTADGFIMIAAEYNSQLPAALCNMIDHFPPASYRHRPISIVNYSMGQFGGARAQMHATTYSAELGMLPLPTKVIIPTAQDAITEDGICSESRIVKNVDKMATELAWYATALKNQKSTEAPPG